MPPNESLPSPDEILARVMAEEEPQKRGELKIFLGYAAGVGKTFTMLEAAHQRRKEIDTVVAYVETHGRKETEALLAGLEIIPPKRLEYHDLTLTEMDLDAILKRRPQLAIVDELAHTNAPNSRHLKRYQDVEEILDAGIDVFTTINIQHIESLRDVVAQITGTWVRETVPDSFIDSANEIEIVDFPPEELLKRLKDGKVYVPDQIAQATSKFFRKGNLTALRELTMRAAARHVDKQKEAYMRTHAIHGPWPTSERLLLCVSLNPSTSLIRNTRRLALQLGAEWFAVHVETPDSTFLSPDKQDTLMATLHLAEKLGAKALTIQGNSVASAVLEFARANNITKIVLGKPRRRFWQNLLGLSIENQIIRRSKQFDVYVITDMGEKAKPVSPAEPLIHNVMNYFFGLGLVMVVTLIGRLAQDILSPATEVLIYLLCVVFTALLWGFGPSIAVSALSVFAFGLFFVFPFQTAIIGEYLFSLLALLMIGVIISYLASQTRQQAQAARRRERETAALYALSRDLTVTNDLDSYVRAIIVRTRETFGLESAIFLPDLKNVGVLKPYADNPEVKFDEKELAAALWSFQHQKEVGHGTDTLPGIKQRFIPLSTARRTVGVLGLWSGEIEVKLTIEQEKLLEAYTDLEALAIEGILNSEEAHNSEILRATDTLQTALLNSFSHDLRAPIVSITEALNSLREGGDKLGIAARDAYIQTASEETALLNHMITNLIDQSRIDAGALRLAVSPAKVQDVVAVALEQLDEDTEKRQVRTDFAPRLPLVSVDFGIIVPALVNILDNAFKYSSPNTPIDLSVRQVGQEVEIAVADMGVGIPAQDLGRVFDKFYRVHRPSSVVGTGLGLSISKGFVEAHGGRIWAENRPGGGTIIKVALPIQGGVESVPDQI